MVLVAGVVLALVVSGVAWAAEMPSDLEATLDLEKEWVLLTWAQGTDSNTHIHYILRVTEVGSDPLWQKHISVYSPTPAFFTYPFDESFGEPFTSDYALRSGKTYIFQIGADNAKETGEWSNKVRVTIPAPSLSGLPPTEEGDNQPTVVLDWAPGTNPRYDEQVVLRREPKQGWVELADLGTNASTYTDTTVKDGKKYIYWIAAMGNGKLLHLSKPMQVTIPE